MTAVDQASLPVDQPVTKNVPNPIIQGISGDCSDRVEDEENPYVQAAPCGEETDKEEEGVAWEKGSEDKACLAKDDRKEDCIDQDPVSLHQLGDNILDIEENSGQREEVRGDHSQYVMVS